MYSTNVYDNKESLPDNELISFYTEHGLDNVKQIAKGEGISIAVLDSGLDFMHDNMVSRFSDGFAIMRNNSEDYVDRVGHGTYISGLITGREFGLLPNAKLHPVKVTDDNGNMTHKTIADGILWAVKKKVDIICMALGTDTDYEELHDAVKIARNNGIMIVASAGNYKETIEYPAKYDEVIAVGGIDFALERAKFSATGEELDMVLPSVDIQSLFSFGRYAESSGSSPATAIATCYVSMLLQIYENQLGIRPNFFQVKSWFKRNSIDLGEEGHDNRYGYGLATFKYLVEKDYDITK